MRRLSCRAGLTWPTPVSHAPVALRAASGRPAAQVRRARPRSPAASGASAATASAPRLGGPRPSSGSTRSAATAPTSAPLPGRFNRLVLQHGVLATTLHYVLGEFMNLSLTYLLHTHLLGVGDVGSWLAAVGVPAERVLNVGPYIYGVQLSPRLVLNYVVANACMYPLMAPQLRLCVAAAPVLLLPAQVLRRWLGLSKRAAVPKAPSSSAE
ncbi:hypothetical protein NESM_000251000 [Novymonas esmeraldas]|uniref:Uncharacterized protein n=1 Tax=Novymonas esmeraldas TaxID=1808958 RepID=A0AAW0F6H1_9TRYP